CCTNLLGLRPSTPALLQYISDLSTTSVKHEVKGYPDAVYYNYFPLGLSFLFSPTSGYKPKAGTAENDLNLEKLSLTGIDVYNVLVTDDEQKKDSRQIINALFRVFPSFPIEISIPDGATDESVAQGTSHSSPSSRTLAITPETTGKAFVEALGEPARKGGGTGPSSGSIGIWCEWPKAGLMVEFGGNDARGPQAWERGKDAQVRPPS
ncbi:hypothetical protein BS47DRAFT_1347985, partial [Hydnum rufescens UP504]